MRIRIPLSSIALLSCLLPLGCTEPNAPASAASPVPAQPAPAVVAAAAPDAAKSADRQALTLLPSSTCNLEALDGANFSGTAVDVSKPFVLRGWLGTDGGAVPSMPELVLDRQDGGAQIIHPLELKFERPDVVAAVPSASLPLVTGFEDRVDTANLGAGRYRMYLRYRLGQSTYVCDNGREVILAK